MYPEQTEQIIEKITTEPDPDFSNIELPEPTEQQITEARQKAEKISTKLKLLHQTYEYSISMNALTRIIHAKA